MTLKDNYNLNFLFRFTH